MKVLAQLPSIYLLAKQAMGDNEASNAGSTAIDGSIDTSQGAGSTSGSAASPDAEVKDQHFQISGLDDLELLYRSSDPKYADPNKTSDQQEGRSFIPGVDLLLNNLQEYGCWCFFDNQHGQGRGQPVDVFDNHCMRYHHAVSCAKLEIDSCDPYSTSYGITTKQDGDGRITYDCESGNNACQEATCYAQSHFIALLLKEQLENLTVPDYPSWSAWKDGGEFDSETCKVSGPSSLRQEMCCGSWKYNTKKLLKFGSHLTRECCDQPDGSFKTYDDNLAECCGNGSVRVIGTC